MVSALEVVSFNAAGAGGVAWFRALALLRSSAAAGLRATTISANGALSACDRPRGGKVEEGSARGSPQILCVGHLVNC